MDSEPIFITGAGIVSPIGIGLEAYWDALLAKRSGIVSLAERTDEGAKPNADSEPLGLWIGAPIIDFDPKIYVKPRKSLKVMCREIQTAYAATQLALEQAGLEACLPASDETSLSPDRIGTVFGSEMFYGPPDEMMGAMRGCLNEDGTGDLVKFGQLAMREIMPLWMLKYLPNMPACHIGISVNAQGPNNSLVLGDVSGPAALIEAMSCIERGIADVVLSGATGTRINTTRMNYRGDMPIPVVNGRVDAASRPHAADATGVVAGEGAASLVLESATSASQRGRQPIAVVSAAVARFVPSARMRDGLSRNGLESKSRSIQDDRGSATAIQLAIEGALAKARLDASDIGLVVSQGMGDRTLDHAERVALAQTLPGVAAVAPVASIGHTGAAIGTIGLVTGLLAIQKRMIPPTLNAEFASPDIRLLKQAEPLTTDHVLCLSHTAEGSAIAIILTVPA